MPFLTCRSHGVLAPSTFRASRGTVQPQFNHEGPRGVRLNALAQPSGPAFEARQTAAFLSPDPKEAGALQNNSVVFEREGVAGSGRVTVKDLIESFERGSQAENGPRACPLAALPSQAAAAAATAGAEHEEATALAIDALALAFGALSIAVGDDVALAPAPAPAAAAAAAAGPAPVLAPAPQAAAPEPALVMAAATVPAEPLPEPAATVAATPEVRPAAEPAAQAPKAAPAGSKSWREQWVGLSEGYEAAKAAVVGMAVVAADALAGVLKGERTKPTPPPTPQATPLASASGVEVWGAAALKLAPTAQLMSSMRRTVAAILLRGLTAPPAGAASKYDPLFHLHCALTSGQGAGSKGAAFALPASLALPAPQGRSKFDPMSDLLGAVDAVFALVSALDAPPADSYARASSKYDPMVELLGAVHAFVSGPSRMQAAAAT